MEEAKGRKWLHSKWWYRLLKVVYLSFFGLVTIGVVVGAIDAAPKKSSYPDSDKSYVVCDNGKRTTVRSLSLYGELTLDSDKRTATGYCTGLGANSVPRGVEGTRYTVDYYYPIEGEWSEALNIFSIGLLSAWFAMWFFKGVFNYVVCGSWKLKADAEPAA